LSFFSSGSGGIFIVDKIWITVLVLGLIVAVSVPHTAVVGFELATVVVVYPPVEGCYSDMGLWCSWICFCSKSLLGWIMSDLVAFLVFGSNESFMLAVFCHMGLLICDFFCACGRFICHPYSCEFSLNMCFFLFWFRIRSRIR
jgi:hypothetical protein